MKIKYIFKPYTDSIQPPLQLAAVKTAVQAVPKRFDIVQLRWQLS